jgi:hypothetical protein
VGPVLWSLVTRSDPIYSAYAFTRAGLIPIGVSSLVGTVLAVAAFRSHLRGGNHARSLGLIIVGLSLCLLGLAFVLTLVWSR